MARYNNYSIFLSQFLLIFRKAAEGTLEIGSGLAELARLAEIDVDETGVRGAKDFFEAKMMQASAGSKFEMEMRLEQEEKRRDAEEKKAKQEAFKNKRAAFQTF